MVYDAEAIRAVRRLVKERLKERNMTGRELASKLGVHESALSHAISPTHSRTRNLGTLALVSSALGWQRNYLSEVLTGQLDAPKRTPTKPRRRTVREYVPPQRTIRENVRVDTERRKRVGYGDRIASLEAEVATLKAAVAALQSRLG